MDRIKPILRAVKEGETPPGPINIEERMSGVLPDCIAKIEAMDYVGAFQQFAQNLEVVERASGQSFFDEPIQKPLRKMLERLWDSFLKDTKDHKKKVARLHALDGQAEEALLEIRATDDKARAEYDALSDDKKRYLRALVRQEAERSAVTTFPNASSLEASFRRNFDRWIKDSIERPAEEAYAPELKHTGYTGELFNSTLPFLREKMKGYVGPLIKGKRGYSNYTPVTAEIVQADIVAFLEEATKLAETFAEINARRDAANSATWLSQRIDNK